MVEVAATYATSAAIAALAAIAAAGIGVHARRAEKTRLDGAFGPEIHRRGAFRVRADDAAMFSPVVQQGSLSRSQGMLSAKVSPA